MKELEIISAILSAKISDEKLNNFNEKLESFFELTKKISVPNERDFLLELDAIKDEMSVIAACPELFGKHVVAVGGGFSAGKSAFINSFLANKEIRLPISMDPTTAIPSYVTNASEQKVLGISKNNATIDFSDICPDILSRLTHNAEEPLDFGFNLKDILPFLVVNVDFKDERFKNICFIDTPGYNPQSEGNKAADVNTAKEFLSDSLAILWLSACDASSGNITTSDINFLKEILKNDKEKKLYIIISKADQKSSEDLQKVLENVKTTLAQNAIEYEGISLYGREARKEGQRAADRGYEEKGFYKLSLFEFLANISKDKISSRHKGIIGRLENVKKEYKSSLDREINKYQKIEEIKSALSWARAFCDDDNNATDQIDEALKIINEIVISSEAEKKGLLKELHSKSSELAVAIGEIFGKQLSLEDIKNIEEDLVEDEEIQTIFDDIKKMLSDAEKDIEKIREQSNTAEQLLADLDDRFDTIASSWDDEDDDDFASSWDDEDYKIFEDLKDVIAEQLSVSRHSISPESRIIEDLGADSLDVVELVMAVEEKFEVEMPDSEAEKIRTVSDIVEFIRQSR